MHQASQVRFSPCCTSNIIALQATKKINPIPMTPKGSIGTSLFPAKSPKNISNGNQIGASKIQHQCNSPSFGRLKPDTKRYAVKQYAMSV